MKSMALPALVGTVVCAALSLSAQETRQVDLFATEGDKVVDKFARIDGRKTFDRSGKFPVTVGETGAYRVWMEYYAPSNKLMNMAVRIDAPTGEPIRYERVDFKNGLRGSKPWEKTVVDRPAGWRWYAFDQTFEYPGTYTFVVSHAAGAAWVRGGQPPHRIAAVWISNDPAFDPSKNAQEKVALRPAKVPAGFLAAREHPMNVALNTGLADAKTRFRSAIHQNYPVFFNSYLLIDAGCDVEQNDYGRTGPNPTGLKGAHGLQRGPDWGTLSKKYPMPKKDENFTPVGRKANNEGKYWNEWSVSFAPANETAYSNDLAEVQKVVASPINARVDSWMIAWEQAGNYDYGETSVQAYRAWLEKRYGTLAKLNAVWHTDYKSFGEIVPAKRADCVGAQKLADPFKRAQATANFIDFRDFCSKEYARLIARRVKASLTDPEKRPIATQFANLDLNAVEWSGWRPLNDEDLFRIGVKEADRYGYDVYAVDDWCGAEYDTLSAFGYDKKRMEVREGSTHTPDPDLAVRSYWTLIGKGLKGFSHFMLQEGNNHAEFPKFGLTNYDQTPRPKLAAYSDAIRAIRQIENVLAPARRQNASKPVAIYYSRTCNALQERSLGSLFDCGPDNVFRVYELIRGNGYPVTFVTDDQIREGDRLSEMSALFFVDAKYIPTDVLEKVEDWVAKGGAVFADAQPGIYDGHGFPQDRFLKFLGIEPVAKKKVDSLAAEKNPFGYSAMSFDVVDADQLHKTQFEFFQQWDSTHPISRAAGKFMFSGFGYQNVDSVAGETIVMAHNGKPAGVLREHGKGTSFYFAGYLGSIYGGAATTYEWRDAHSDPSPYRFMDAYLAFVGAQKVATADLPQRVRTKMRFESPLVDARGNAVLSVTSYNDAPVGPFRVQWKLAPGVKAPRGVYVLRQGSRQLEPVAFTLEKGQLGFEMPRFKNFAAVLALNDAQPLVSVDFGAAKRTDAGLVELNPGQAVTAQVRVFNPSATPLKAGQVTVRLPKGWFYDHETVAVPELPAYGASAELAFTIRTPDNCAATRFRPVNFIYENADVKSMPTAEVVWWKDAE